MSGVQEVIGVEMPLWLENYNIPAQMPFFWVPSEPGIMLLAPSISTYHVSHKLLSNLLSNRLQKIGIRYKPELAQSSNVFDQETGL